MGSYVYQPFPKMVYHADGRYRVVPDEAAWRALGPGWGHLDEGPASRNDVEVVAEIEAALVAEPPRKRGRPKKDVVPDAERD